MRGKLVIRAKTNFLILQAITNANPEAMKMAYKAFIFSQKFEKINYD
jgi:UDP-N-acetylmuramyl pentapeptide synthase